MAKNKYDMMAKALLKEKNPAFIAQLKEFHEIRARAQAKRDKGSDGQSTLAKAMDSAMGSHVEQDRKDSVAASKSEKSHRITIKDESSGSGDKDSPKASDSESDLKGMYRFHSDNAAKYDEAARVHKDLAADSTKNGDAKTAAEHTAHAAEAKAKSDSAFKKADAHLAALKEKREGPTGEKAPKDKGSDKSVQTGPKGSSEKADFHMAKAAEHREQKGALHVVAAQKHTNAAAAHQRGDGDASVLSKEAHRLSEKADKDKDGASKSADSKSVQTGPKGGRYYTSASGEKVYVNK
jgi:colicin import membrane protein